MTVPPLVARARALGSGHAPAGRVRDEDGRLLHVLAGRRGVERVAEIGTGAGVGAAWISSALPPGVPLFTVEADPGPAAAATGLFAGDPDVHVLAGDWRVVLPPHAPFDLVVAAGGGAEDDPDALLGLAAPGATIVVDGPGTDTRARRERWLGHPRLVVAELGTGDGAVSLVALVRR